LESSNQLREIVGILGETRGNRRRAQMGEEEQKGVPLSIKIFYKKKSFEGFTFP
jgi:hypothetical protein